MIVECGNWNGELDVTTKNGNNCPVGIRVTRVDDPRSGMPAHYIWILADITERRQAEERMRHIAQHDALTGLPNRLALLMRLAQLLPEARRHHWNIAIMFIDLDRFKIINDTLGHQIGDEMLREVACRLSSVIRETDFVARLGGDEFVILLPAIATPADAAIVANKIIAALSTAIQVDGHELHTSPSIGISLFPDDGPDGDSILKNADTAMYHAKSAGRNNYQFFATEMNQATTERLDIERKLRHAIARNELTLCFQPQFAANGTRPTGIEALVRWLHPTDGMIRPDRFIPVAEETGIIVEIGEWVLRNACREMKHWIDAGLAPIRIAVNVSARQLRRRDFCETVAGALAESGLPPELLELEITESSVMENPDEAIQILQRLGRMGVTLAIDDFGTGYSSLAYLKLFPIDHLKIDRSFVADIEHDLNDRAIAFGTIALAHSLGLNVIAEGVETEDQLELLRTNGCDEVQGYLFSKPLNGAAAFAFLHARQTTE
jgi:diguanylate cyclase (GGDEF)-like protein